MRTERASRRKYTALGCAGVVRMSRLGVQGGGVRQEELHQGGEAGEKRNKEGPVRRGTCEKTG